MATELRDEVQRILGEGYRIERELAGGSMARVFVADEVGARRKVVIKVLAADVAAEVNIDRFRREIQVAQQLDHPHAVPVLAAGQSGDVLYYTMPYIEGETLRSRIERERQLPVDVALDIARDVAAALAYAHQRNIVHRDIKPSNILIDRAGRALVSDFGIARAIEKATDIVSLTSTGHTLGTPTYMSPEQASASENIDGRSDIYSLGCVLYEMLAGQPPFTGPTAQSIIARHLNEPPPSLRIVRPQLAETVQRVIEKALAKVPADRYRDAEAFGDALSNPEIALKWRSTGAAPQKKTGARLVAVVAAVAAATAAIVVIQDRRAPGPPAQTLDGSRIAVLYFDAPASDSSLVSLGRWLTRDLISALSSVREFTLTSEAGIQDFGTRVPIDSVVKRLGVGTIVSGALEPRADSIRLDVQLIDGARGDVAGSVHDTYSREALVRLRDSVVQRVARELTQKLAPEVRVREWRAGTDSPRAWELRQQAQDLIESEAHTPRRTGDLSPRVAILRKADSLLAQAAAADPRWSEPVIERGWLWRRLASFEPSARMMPIIDTGLVFAQRALSQNPTDPRALALRGTLRYQAWASVPGAPPSLLDSARTDLVAATTSDPHLARAWSALGSVLQMQGDSAGAIGALRSALAADVYVRDTPRTINQLIVAYLFAGKNDSARTLCTESARTYPRDPTLGPCELTVLGWTGKGTRDVQRTWALVAEMERGGFWPLIDGMSPEARFFAAAVLARSGLGDSARATAAATRRRLTAAGLPTSNSLGEAYVYVLLGEHAAAVDALERGIANDSTLRDRATRLPWFTPLRQDPRFRGLVETRNARRGTR